MEEVYGTMEIKCKVDYDAKSDVLWLYSEPEKTKESVIISKDLVLDLDAHDRVIGVELFWAHELLHTLNPRITEEMLGALREAWVKVIPYRQHRIIALRFAHGGRMITERLPMFSNPDSALAAVS